MKFSSQMFVVALLHLLSSSLSIGQPHPKKPKGDIFSSKASSVGPMNLNVNSTKTTLPNGQLGLSLNFIVSLPPTFYGKNKMKNFTEFVSVGIHALSDSFALNPNEWKVQADSTTGDYSLSSQSGWSSTFRYGNSSNTAFKNVALMDEKADPAYEYKWQLAGTVTNKGQNMKDFICEINIEIQRKSYFSTDFKILKNVKPSKTDIRDFIQTVLITTYYKYASEKNWEYRKDATDVL